MRSIRIPADRVGTLIGKKGEIKKTLQDISGIKIDINTEEGEIALSAVKSAFTFVTSIQDEVHRFAIAYQRTLHKKAAGRGFNPDKAMRLFEDDEYLEVVDLKEFIGERSGQMHRVRGRLIGKDGKTRRIIEDLTGVDMVIYGNTVGLIGNSISLPVAKHAVELILQGSEHATVYHYLESQRPRLRIAEMGFDL